MSINLVNRIVTSFILFGILLSCLFLNTFLWLYLLIITGIISFYEFNNLLIRNFKKDKFKIYFSNILSFLYLSFFIFIGYYFNNNSKIDLLFILLICIFSDIGGYLIGKLIGGKKLTKISPNKTISGSIGSFVFSLFPVLFFLKINNMGYDYFFITIINFKNISFLILICFFLSLICQLGDLFISYFKRKAKVKDTGSILPGHGGLLDRIDGIIFVLPVAFFLNKLFL